MSGWGGQGERWATGPTLDKRDPDHSARTNRMATRWEQVGDLAEMLLQLEIAIKIAE